MFKTRISILVIIVCVSAFILMQADESINSPLASLSFNSKNIEKIGKGGFNNSIAVDSKGNPAVSYIKKGEGLFFAQKTEGSWEKEKVAEDSLAGNQTSLAFNSNGTPHILYINKDFSLKLAKRKAEEEKWEIKQIHKDAASSCDIGFYNEDDDTRGYISFWNPSQGMMYGIKTSKDKGWKTGLLEGGEVGKWSSLKVGEQGIAHVSYLDFGKKELVYANYGKGESGGKRWRKQTVDFANVGAWNSIALDEDDSPSIGYADKKDNSLKYAKQNQTGWEIENLENLKGEEISFGYLGNSPIISFYDGGEKELVLIKKTQNSWEKYTIGSSVGDNSMAIQDNQIFLSWQDSADNSNTLKFLKIE